MKVRALLLLFTLAGMAARLWIADWGGLSGDEANGVAIAVTGSWGDMLAHLRQDGNPPLFYALLRLFSQLFGEADFSLRLAAVCLSTALIPATYFGARLLHLPPASALTAAALTAFCPPLIRYGTMVRMYGLLPLLSLASTVCFARLVSGGTGRAETARWACAYALATTLTIYCHHWGFLVVAGQIGAALLMLTARSGERASLWKALKPWLAALVVAGLLYLPWLPDLLYILGHDESPWGQAPALTHLIIETPPEMLIGRLSLREAWAELGIVYAGVLFWSTLAFASAAAGSDSPERRKVDAMRLTVLAGLFIALTLSSLKPAWRDRYLVAFTPVVIMLFCVFIRPFAARTVSSIRRALPPSLLALLLFLPVWVPQLLWLDSTPESSAWAVSEKILKESNPDRDLIVVSWEASAPAMSRTLPEKYRILSFPDLERVRIVRWDGINQRVRDERLLLELLATIKTALADGGNVFLVDSAHSTAATPPPGSSRFDGKHFNEVEQVRMDQIRNFLATSAVKKETTLWAPGRDLSLFLSVYGPGPPSRQTGQSAPGPDRALSTYFEHGSPGGSGTTSGGGETGAGVEGDGP